MTLRTRIGLSLLLLLLVTVLAATLFVTVDAGAAPDLVPPAPNTTIAVSGTGEVTAPPDLAVVAVAVTATAPTADVARGRVADNVSRLRTALADQNVTGDRLRTTSYALVSVRENGTTVYRATHGLELRVPVADAGTIVDVAVGNGADRVDGVQFTLADDTRRALRHRALELALASARADADVVANATGVAVTDVLTVHTSDVGMVPFAAEAARSPEGTSFEPGPVTVTATVSVTYRAH